jgi:alkanesulfonate monooxygenase SsuD/methylene tetrahydromethanopterin reductase-like flavin-dependent oxidoreductase (luciferase family)
MSKLNGSGNSRRIWRTLPVISSELLVPLVQQAEDDGVEGVFAYQVYGPPFIPLAVAAGATKTLKLASGIAIAATRSPFETAMAARDLDTISDGRFTLGLGSSVPVWTSGVYGGPPIKPLAHLRETVDVVRYLHANAHLGLEPYEGTYYKADFAAFRGVLAPPIKPHMPIWLAAMREKLTRMAVEIGDGVIGHPMWSVEWALNEMKPAIEDELQKCNKVRSDIEISIWPFAAINPNEQEALDDARPTVAFYAGAAPYEIVFEKQGFLNEARALQTAVAEEGFLAASRLVPDEMVRAFVAVGSPDKVRERIEPIWQLADSICVSPPTYALTPEKLQYYSDMIASTFPPDSL